MNPASFLNRASDKVSRLTLIRVLARRLDQPESRIRAWPDEPIPSNLEPTLEADYQDLLAGRPEAYVLGDMPFLEWDFKADERALIPRPETEDLCARMIDRLRPAPPTRVLDLCCGSGVMGLSMALAFPKSRVLLTDISRQALDLCAENIALHQLQTRAETAQGDLWDAVPAEAAFDLILANPPYVADEDPVQESVLQYEPHQALYSHDRGMAHIKQILEQLPRRLLPGGVAAFELGHNHQQQLESWLKTRFPTEKFHWMQDPFGVSRFLVYDCPNVPD